MPTTDPKKTVDMSKILRVYSGSANRPLAQKIANQLGVELSGLTLTQVANGEIYARYDEPVRGADVLLLQAVAGENVNVCATHGIFSGEAVQRLTDAPIVECEFTDAIPAVEGGKIKSISVAGEFAE